MDNSFSSFSDILKKKQAEAKKAPAYPWQDLALQVIKDLNIPNFKRSAVFKICKENYFYRWYKFTFSEGH